jgi:hypothetical protein
VVLYDKCAKKDKKVRKQRFDEIETTPLIYSGYAIMTESEDKKEIVEKLKLQYQKEYDKLRYCGTDKLPV